MVAGPLTCRHPLQGWCRAGVTKCGQAGDRGACGQVVRQEIRGACGHVVRQEIEARAGM